MSFEGELSYRQGEKITGLCKLVIKADAKRRYQNIMLRNLTLGQ